MGLKVNSTETELRAQIAALQADNGSLMDALNMERRANEKRGFSGKIIAEHKTMRDVLDQIAANKRKTMEQRLANSCIKFLDALK